MLEKAKNDLKDDDDSEDTDYYKDYANEVEEPGSDMDNEDEKDIDDDALGFVEKTSDNEAQADKDDDSDEMEETKDEPAKGRKKAAGSEDTD